MIRLVVAEDQAVVRQSVVRYLAAAADLQVVAEAATGDEALARVREVQPDVLLLDIGMPGRDGLAVGAALRRDGSPIRLLFLTMYRDDATLRAAMRMRADGLLLKTDPVDDVLGAVRAVAGGRTWWSPEVADRMTTLRRQSPAAQEAEAVDDRRLLASALGAVLSDRDGVAGAGMDVSPARLEELWRLSDRLRAEDELHLAPFRRLSPSEQGVLAAMVDGKAAEVIAAERFVSLTTVRAQIRAVLRKLDVHSQLGAVAMARRAGWPRGHLGQLPTVTDVLSEQAGPA